jgi:hypothetical protein
LGIAATSFSAGFAAPLVPLISHIGGSWGAADATEVRDALKPFHSLANIVALASDGTYAIPIIHADKLDSTTLLERLDQLLLAGRELEKLGDWLSIFSGGAVGIFPLFVYLHNNQYEQNKPILLEEGFKIRNNNTSWWNPLEGATTTALRAGCISIPKRTIVWSNLTGITATISNTPLRKISLPHNLPIQDKELQDIFRLQKSV